MMSLGWFLEVAFLVAGATVASIPTQTVISYCLIVVAYTKDHFYFV